MLSADSLVGYKFDKNLVEMWYEQIFTKAGQNVVFKNFISFDFKQILTRKIQSRFWIDNLDNSIKVIKVLD